jgi:hypothetical protein
MARVVGVVGAGEGEGDQEIGQLTPLSSIYLLQLLRKIAVLVEGTGERPKKPHSDKRTYQALSLGSRSKEGWAIVATFATRL